MRNRTVHCPIAKNVAVGSNTGTLVSAVIGSMGPNGGIGDVDVGALGDRHYRGESEQRDLAVFHERGYELANFGTTSSPCMLLAADGTTRIRFLPKTNFNGSAGFTYLAWDRTSGSNGASTSAATRGGASPFSLTKETALILVNAAPVLNANGNPTLDPIVGSSADLDNPGILVSGLIARMSPGGGITDVDGAFAGGMAVIGANQMHGVWQFSTNGGTNWNNSGTRGLESRIAVGADDSHPL